MMITKVMMTMRMMAVVLFLMMPTKMTMAMTK